MLKDHAEVVLPSRLPRDCGDPRVNDYFDLIRNDLGEIDRLLNSLDGIPRGFFSDASELQSASEVFDSSQVLRLSSGQSRD